MAILLLYVNDIILMASSSLLLNRFLHHLKAEFSMTYMGALHYFLGIQVTKNAHGLFLSQSKYTSDLLSRANMQRASPVDTPMTPRSSSITQMGKFHNPSMYRNIVGALQYLTFT